MEEDQQGNLWWKDKIAKELNLALCDKASYNGSVVNDQRCNVNIVTDFKWRGLTGYLSENKR